MTLQETYKTLENDCFNLLTVDPNPLHDLNHFSLILRLENTHGNTALCLRQKKKYTMDENKGPSSSFASTHRPG